MSRRMRRDHELHGGGAPRRLKITFSRRCTAIAHIHRKVGASCVAGSCDITAAGQSRAVAFSTRPGSMLL